jgi:dihydroorotate dehydrogenase electron transfer subunit
MIIQKKFEIKSNVKIAENYFCLAFDAPALAKQSKPGQFISLRINEKNLLLRRPFGVYDCQKTIFKIVYKVVGRGTRALTLLKKGDQVDILGPLGNGFTIAPAKRHIIVGGGVGIAPLYYLAKKINKPKLTTIILGAKTKGELAGEKEFKALGCGVAVATEDGSKGTKGFVTVPLEDELKKLNNPRTPFSKGDQISVYACGPKGMLKATSEIAERYGAPCQVSLEEYMACGVGTCMGCVIKIKSEVDTEGYEFKRVCKEGPVFDSESIIWD